MARPKSPVRLHWVDPEFCSLEYRLKIIGRLPFLSTCPPMQFLESMRCSMIEMCWRTNEFILKG